MMKSLDRGNQCFVHTVPSGICIHVVLYVNLISTCSYVNSHHSKHVGVGTGVEATIEMENLSINLYVIIHRYTHSACTYMYIPEVGQR